MKALSIQQPWAQLIVEGFKPVENRSWPTSARGPVLIHAGKKFDIESYFWLRNNWIGLALETEQKCRLGDFLNRTPAQFTVGGIVGRAEITDCVTSHPSPFFCGPYGFVMANPQPIPFAPMRGRLGFFNVEWPSDEELALTETAWREHYSNPATADLPFKGTA